MTLDKGLDKILIIDFGSQFTQLIVRRIRELGVFSELISHKKIKSSQIKTNVKGIILSGGPLNVYQLNDNLFDNKYGSCEQRFAGSDTGCLNTYENDFTLRIFGLTNSDSLRVYRNIINIF